MLQGGPNSKAEKQSDKTGVKRPNRPDQFLVDAEHKGHRAPGDPRNDIGGPHTEALCSQHRVARKWMVGIVG